MLASWSPETIVTQSWHFSSPDTPYPDTKDVSRERPIRSMVTIMISGDNW